MDLEQFTGTTKWYRHPFFKGCIYTDGINYMAENCRAYWLIDAVFSYVPQIETVGEWFFPVHLSKKDGKENWTLKIGDSENSRIFRQDIGYSDFPMDHIMLFLAKNDAFWTLFLPSEY